MDEISRLEQNQEQSLEVCHEENQEGSLELNLEREGLERESLILESFRLWVGKILQWMRIACDYQTLVWKFLATMIVLIEMTPLCENHRMCSLHHYQLQRRHEEQDFMMTFRKICQMLFSKRVQHKKQMDNTKDQEHQSMRTHQMKKKFLMKTSEIHLTKSSTTALIEEIIKFKCQLMVDHRNCMLQEALHTEEVMRKRRRTLQISWET